MARFKAGITALILILVVSGLASAQGQPPLVKYELHVIELASEEERALLLEAFEFQGALAATEFAFELLSGGNLSGIFGGVPFRVKAEDKTGRSMRLAAPAVIVSLGRTATLRVVEEKLMPELAVSGSAFRTRGVEITVSPLMVDPRTQEISTTYAVQTHSDENAIQATVRQQNGESLPLAIVRFAEQGRDRTQDRCFAVFATAEIMAELPDTGTVSVGGLGGLANLLWQEEAVLDRENYFWIALPLNPVGLPEAGFQVGTRVYLRADLQHASYSPASLAGGISLRPEGLDLELQFLWYEGKAYTGLGLGDSLEAVPGLTLYGGWLPAVFDLADFSRLGSMYWFGASLNRRPFTVGIRYLSGLGEEPPTVQTELGYALKDSLDLLVKLSINKERGNRFSTGLRFAF